MTDQADLAFVGVRPADADQRRASPIVWAQPGALDLAFGDRVTVLQSGQEWLGEVVVPADRLVEWPRPFSDQLPIVSRRATDDDWPEPPVTDGRRLLDSLGLSRELLVRSRPGSAPGPLVAHAAPGAREATENDRGDQERGGDQRESE